MTQQVLEGTWEEIRAHEPELAGQHVRLTFFRPERPVQQPQAPPVIYDPSSYSILTNEIRDVLEPFIDLLLADIRQHAINASKIEILGMEYPDDGTDQISVRLWLNCASDTEMWRYFEDFFSRADGWIKNLSTVHRTVFCRKISLMTWRAKNV